jgi:hypothetical protein
MCESVCVSACERVCVCLYERVCMQVCLCVNSCAAVGLAYFIEYALMVQAGAILH